MPDTTPPSIPPPWDPEHLEAALGVLLDGDETLERLTASVRRAELPLTDDYGHLTREVEELVDAVTEEAMYRASVAERRALTLGLIAGSAASCFHHGPEREGAIELVLADTLRDLTSGTLTLPTELEDAVSLGLRLARSIPQASVGGAA